MEKRDKIISKKLDELDTETLVLVLQEQNLEEFIEFVKTKHLDGRKLLVSVSYSSSTHGFIKK